MTETDDEIAGPAPAGTVRFQVLGFFAALATITYLDRICMSQAAGPISQALHLDKRQMGFVFSAFTLSYMLFEVPTGWLGDRIGPRRVLFRVVVWWSVFTALTGWAPGLVAMLAIRFAFGAGEAGAFPNIARALTTWFPPEQRGRAQGVIWTTARLGGAVAPPLTAGIINLIGWRATFVVYGLIGLAWASAFWVWYRDEPADHPSVSPEELKWINSWRKERTSQVSEPEVPWSQILKNPSVWGLAGSTGFVAFAWFFNATWLPTYLKEERGVDVNRASFYAALPFVFGVAGSALGGWLSDRLVRTFLGPRWARRAVGFTGSMLAGVCFLAGLRIHDTAVAIVFLSLAGFFTDTTLASLWATSMDIGERHAGRVAGLMNTVSGLGGFLSPIVFGEILNRGYGWTPAFLITGTGFGLSGLCWLLADPNRTVANPSGRFDA